MDVSEEQQAAAAARGAGGREGRREDGRRPGGGLFFPGVPFLWPAFSRTKPTKRKTKRNKITPNYIEMRCNKFSCQALKYGANEDSFATLRRRLRGLIADWHA